MPRKEIIKAIGDFKKVFSKIGEDFEKDTMDLLRESMLKMNSDLASFTPRDTGWASQHWSMGVNRTTEDEAVVIDVAALNKLAFGDVVYHYNNVPYIKRLDEGWSQQRPTGFTDLVVIKISNYLIKKVKKLSDKRIP